MIIAAQVCDTHVRNLERHEEYRKVFSELYSQLRGAKVDIIVHCGDIVHQKTNITPELVDMVSDFLRNLSEIAPLYIIPGNHDGIISNKSRQDAITPIINSLNIPNITYVKNTKRVVHFYKEYKINFDVYSCFDKIERMELAEDDPDFTNLNVALYHGPLNNAQTDLGFALNDDSYLKKSFFDGYDFVMLGDIHKRQLLDKDGRFAYAGSTVQQNFGETDDKGCLIWSIESRDKWKVNSIIIPNPYPFVTHNLSESLIAPRIKNARMRLVGTKEEYIKFVANSDISSAMSCIHSSTDDDFAAMSANIGAIKTDLSTTKAQNEFIESNFSFDDKELQAILNLNTYYNKKINARQKTNSSWSITSFEWEGLFNFKGLQKIDFKTKNSIGIFGKNYSGKSSIVESIIWTIFGRTSKNISKNEDFLNQDSNNGFGKIDLSIGGKEYQIERKLKSTKTVKAELIFKQGTNDLTGVSIRDTEKAIQEVFGSYEDFILLSLSSQFDNFGLVDHRDSKRKEIISKFLDLDFFNEIEPIVKEDILKQRASLNSAKKDFSKEISDLELENIGLGILLDLETNTLFVQELSLDVKNNSLFELDKEINGLQVVSIDIDNLNKGKLKLEKEFDDYQNQIKQKEEDIRDNNIILETTKKSLLGCNIDKINEECSKFKLTNEVTRSINLQLNLLKSKLQSAKNQKKIVENVPCEGKYSSCQFIKNAIIEKDSIPDIELEMKSKIEELDAWAKDEIEDPNPKLEKYKSLTEFLSKTEIKINSLGNELKLINVLLSKVISNISNIDKQIAEYYKNEKLLVLKKGKLEEKNILLGEIKNISKSILDLKLGIFKTKDKIERNVEKMKTLEKEKGSWGNDNSKLANLEKYKKIVSKNGLPLLLIEKVIPAINNITNKILNEIVDFSALIKIVDDKILIFLNRNNKLIPIEACSGAEKTLVSITLRAALYSVTPLSKSKFLILDEPGTSLDKDHILNFKNLLNILEDIFDTIIVITHLDELKDTVKTIIEVDKGKII